MAALMLFIGMFVTAPFHARADDTGGSKVLRSIKPTFFVLSDGDKNTIVTVGVARELQKALNGPSADPFNAATPWIVPEASWTQDSLLTQCREDPNALGGVIITYYAGSATHFFLLWQSETTTFFVYAEIVACNNRSPAMVGLVSELPGANGTPWIERRSQVSIPLISVAAWTTLLSKNGLNSKSSSTNSVTSGALLASIFSGASTRDIPGYSDPVRLRSGSAHIGDDLVRAMRAMCAAKEDASPSALAPRTQLCSALKLTQ